MTGPVAAYFDAAIATYDAILHRTIISAGTFDALKVARAELAPLLNEHPPTLVKLPEQPIEWYWAESFDAEAWHGRRFSREDAVANAITDPCFDGMDGFWLVSGRLRLPERAIPHEFVQKLLVQVEEDPCWFEDCGIDADEAFAQRCEPAGLETVLAAAFEHWLATECDLSASRMIDDFLTMEFYRKVDLGDGLLGAQLEPETVP
jgi:hypothetical protein